jgi:hypothetical protein
MILGMGNGQQDHSDKHKHGSDKRVSEGSFEKNRCIALGHFNLPEAWRVCAVIIS